MNFTASNYNQTIPSRSSFVPSDNQLRYTDGQTIRFEIPSFMGFIDPRQTYLKFKVKVNNAPALCSFSKKCGIHSLINNLRIYDANTNLQLETIMNYGELAEKLHYFTENQSVRNRRGLTELLEYTSRDFDGEYYDDKPSRNTSQSQLFNHKFLTGNVVGSTFTADTSVVSDANTCEVAMRLYSGILGEPSTKMFPAMLTNGLRMELDLNTAGKALEVWCGDGICNDDGDVISDLTGSCRFGIRNASSTDATPITYVDLYCEKNAGFNQLVFSPTPADLQIPSKDADFELVKNQLCGAVNLIKGKTLYGFKNDWDGATAPVALGTIGDITCNAGVNGAGLLVGVRVELIGSTITGEELIGGAGNIDDGTAGEPANNTCFVKQEDIFGGNTPPSLEIDDVELVVKTATPPKDYVDKLLKSSTTQEGAVIDFLTYSVYRNNIQATENVAQINIPALNNRAVSIMTLPTENGVQERVDKGNFDTYVDDANHYYFLVNGKSQPTRRVDLTPLSEPQQFSSQVALFETEKALGSGKVNVRNLNLQSDNFVISRALARYGGVYPLVKDGNISLKVSYDNPTKNKNMITYITGIRRLIVNAEGSKVEM